MPDIHLFDGQKFLDTTVKSTTVAQLKEELKDFNGYSLSGALSVNSVSQLHGRKEIKDGDIIAGVTSDKTGA